MILVAMVLVAICGATTTAILGFIESKSMPWRRERVAA
jgi:ABC-type nitrate/sulfonate/bicarbonate transport system permease component